MHLQDIEELLPSWLINSTNYYVVVIDWSGTYLYANILFKKLFPLSKHDVIGKNYQNIIHPDELDLYTKLVNDCRSGSSKTRQMKFRKNLSPQNHNFWILWEFIPFQNKNGETIGVLQIGHDIIDYTALYDQSRAFYKKINTILASMSDGFYMLNNEWNFLYINPVAEQVLGKARNAMIGKPIWDIFPETIDTEMYHLYYQAIQEQKSQSFEVFHPILQQWYEISAHPSTEGLAVFFKNITEKRWIEEQLRYSENKLRAILDSTTDANVLVSPQYKVLCVNKVGESNMRSAWGDTVREGDNIWDYISPEITEDFKQEFELCLQGQVINKEKELTFGTQTFWFRVAYYPVYDRNNALLGVSMNSTNIDKEKRAEKLIVSSEHKLNAIYNSYTDSHILIDKNLRILSYNAIAESWALELFNKPLEIEGNFSPFIVKGTEEEFYQNFQQALAGEHIEVQRKRHFEHLQQSIWFLIRYTPVYDRENNIVGVALNSINISKIKEAEEKIALQNETLRHIAWKQSHEVRRPVANILGLALLIKEEFENKKTIYTPQYIDFLEQTTQELDTIIHQIVRLANEITEEDANLLNSST